MTKGRFGQSGPSVYFSAAHFTSLCTSHYCKNHCSKKIPQFFFFLFFFLIRSELLKLSYWRVFEWGKEAVSSTVNDTCPLQLKPCQTIKILFILAGTNEQMKWFSLSFLLFLPPLQLLIFNVLRVLMASTVASLFTALPPHQGQRHTQRSDGTSSPEYQKEIPAACFDGRQIEQCPRLDVGVMTPGLSPSGGETGAQGWTKVSADREWFTLRSRWAFSPPPPPKRKKRERKILLSTYCTARSMVHVWICKWGWCMIASTQRYSTSFRCGGAFRMLGLEQRVSMETVTTAAHGEGVDWRNGFSFGEQWQWGALALGRNWEYQAGTLSGEQRAAYLYLI